jgi:hypothetical protein
MVMMIWWGYSGSDRKLEVGTADDGANNGAALKFLQEPEPLKSYVAPPNTDFNICGTALLQ